MAKSSKAWLLCKELLRAVMSYKFCNSYIHLIFDAFLKHIALACLLVFVLFYIGHGGIGSLCLLSLCLFSVFRCLEHNLLYHTDDPATSRHFVELPSVYGLPYEALTIPSAGGSMLHAYLILRSSVPERPQVPTVLFLHGNAGNIGHRLVWCQQLYHLCRVNILLLEYRGFGKSTGTPSECGFYEDAANGLRLLLNRPDIDQSRIVVFGRSLGGAVGIELVGRSEFVGRVRGLIVENSFTSLPATCRSIFNFPPLTSVPDWLLRNQYQSLEKIRSVQLPTLFISGLNDSLIPPAMMTQLYEKCPNAHASIVRFEAGGHNDTWTMPGYFDSINSFVVRINANKAVLQTRGDVVIKV